MRPSSPSTSGRSSAARSRKRSCGSARTTTPPSERVSRTYDALRASVAAAQEIAARPVAAAPPPDLGTRSNPKLTRMIAHVLADLPPDVQIGARSVTAAINRRFGPHLRKPADPERVSIALRRLSEVGNLHRLRKGKPHHEALYSRQPPAE